MTATVQRFAAQLTAGPIVLIAHLGLVTPQSVPSMSILGENRV